MNLEENEKWITDSWEFLLKIFKSTHFDDLYNTWNSHKSNDSLKAVIFGVYDSGKSTLLKRLLVEDGKKIPEWLTISGRKETFEVGTVELSEFSITDTPGIAGGNAEHDDIAFESLELADLYIWVLPPQLVTDKKEQLLAFLDGSYFGLKGKPELVTEATVAVIARMDEAGINPEDDISGYQDLCRRKINEFKDSIAEYGIVSTVRGEHAIASDPFQMVGTNPNPDMAMYSDGRSWDNIEELRSSFQSAAKVRPKLRILSGVRYTASIITKAIIELEKLVLENAELIETCVDEAERNKLLTERMDCLLGDAKAEFRRRMEDVLLSALRRGFNPTQEDLLSLENKLTKSVDQWSSEYYQKFSALVADTDAQISQRISSPSIRRFFTGLARSIESTNIDNNRQINLSKIGKGVTKAGTGTKAAFKNYAKAELGMTLDAAAKKLSQISDSGKSFQEFVAEKGVKSGFNSVENYQRASKFVKWGKILDVAGPILAQFGEAAGEIVGEFKDTKEAQKRAKKRSELRDQISKIIQEIENESIKGFADSADAFKTWSRIRKDGFIDIKVGLERKNSEFTSSLNRLEGRITALNHG